MNRLAREKNTKLQAAFLFWKWPVVLWFLHCPVLKIRRGKCTCTNNNLNQVSMWKPSLECTLILCTLCWQHNRPAMQSWMCLLYSVFKKQTNKQTCWLSNAPSLLHWFGVETQWDKSSSGAIQASCKGWQSYSAGTSPNERQLNKYWQRVFYRSQLRRKP